MNLNEAIIHTEKVALDKSSEMVERASGMLGVTDCKECMEQHLQLAEWLKELKQYRTIGTVEECREARERQRAKKPEKYGTVRQGLDNDGAFHKPPRRLLYMPEL